MLKLYRECVSFSYDGKPSRSSLDVDGVEVDGVLYAKMPFGDLQKVGGVFGGEWHKTPEEARLAGVEKLKRVAEAIQAEITKLEATA